MRYGNNFRYPVGVFVIRANMHAICCSAVLNIVWEKSSQKQQRELEGKKFNYTTSEAIIVVVRRLYSAQKKLFNITKNARNARKEIRQIFRVKCDGINDAHWRDERENPFSRTLRFSVNFRRLFTHRKHHWRIARHRKSPTLCTAAGGVCFARDKTQLQFSHQQKKEFFFLNEKKNRVWHILLPFCAVL